MPYLTSEHYAYDDFFDCGKNEKRLFEVNLEMFLLLIKYAKYVFTDSFHMTLFSGIFEKQFYVFECTIQVSMCSRINSLMNLYRII